MNQRQLKLLLISAGVIVVAVAVMILWGSLAKDGGAPVETAAPTTMAPAETPASTPTPTPTAAPEETPAPEPNLSSMTLAIAGDIVLHPGLSSEAETDGTYDYSSVFGGATGYLSAADYAVATLKGTFPGETTYTGYPLIKAPDAVASAISEIGIDLVSTATSHAFDSELRGVTRTLDVLAEAGVASVGTNRSQEALDEGRGVVFAEVNSIKLAFLAYTCIEEVVDMGSDSYAVNLIYDAETGEYDHDRIQGDLDYAHAQGADVTVVFLQWGNEYYTTPNSSQTELADFLFLQGADIVIGGHTYVPQPMELRQVTDKYGREKTAYIVYSMGNLVSCLTDAYTNLTAIVDVTIEKNLDTGVTGIRAVSYVPMFMVDLDAYNITGAGWRYRLWDLHTALDSYAAGNDLGVINDRLYEALNQGLADIHGIFGAELDEYGD